jgi:hypothetical protein
MPHNVIVRPGRDALNLARHFSAGFECEQTVIVP